MHSHSSEFPDDFLYELFNKLDPEEGRSLRQVSKFFLEKVDGPPPQATPTDTHSVSTAPYAKSSPISIKARSSTAASDVSAALIASNVHTFWQIHGFCNLKAYLHAKRYAQIAHEILSTDAVIDAGVCVLACGSNELKEGLCITNDTNDPTNVNLLSRVIKTKKNEYKSCNVYHLNAIPEMPQRIVHIPHSRPDLFSAYNKPYVILMVVKDQAELDALMQQLSELKPTFPQVSAGLVMVAHLGDTTLQYVKYPMIRALIQFSNAQNKTEEGNCITQCVWTHLENLADQHATQKIQASVLSCSTSEISSLDDVRVNFFLAGSSPTFGY